MCDLIHTYTHINEAGVDVVRVFIFRQSFKHHSVEVICIIHSYEREANMLDTRNSFSGIDLCQAHNMHTACRAYMERCFQSDYEHCYLESELPHSLPWETYQWPVQDRIRM